MLELVIFFTMNPKSKFKILFFAGGGGGGDERGGGARVSEIFVQRI